jgi:hypothetical protein
VSKASTVQQSTCAPNHTHRIAQTQELRLFVYEGLLFSVLHMSLGNAAAAGFITALITCLLAWVRRHWGANNLARKTLTDRHFLI